jgi:hypothetical protein
MTRESHTHGRRFTALLLAVLFLLQSAAQAGSGCISSVLPGGCCCDAAATDTGAEMPASSCCAERAGHARAELPGPHVAQDGGCKCEVAPAPSTPADKVASPTVERSRGERDADASAGFAQWIAIAAPAEPCFDPPLVLRPTGPPARTAPASLATARLAHRGVLGLLSELCTVRC